MGGRGFEPRLQLPQSRVLSRLYYSPFFRHLNKKVYKCLFKFAFLMATKKLKCISCNVDIANMSGSVRFLCPQCEKVEIIRCWHCRKISARYTCGCGFSGPN